MELGAQEFCRFVSYGAYRLCDYGFLNGRENMDTQFVRMLDTATATPRASLSAIAACAKLPNDSYICRGKYCAFAVVFGYIL